jgi:hypothetical protein
MDPLDASLSDIEPNDGDLDFLLDSYELVSPLPFSIRTECVLQVTRLEIKITGEALDFNKPNEIFQV